MYVAAAFPSIARRHSTIHHETMPTFSHQSAASLMESDGSSRCTAATTATFGRGLVMVLRRRAPATPPWPGDTAPEYHCAKRRLRRAACWQPLPFDGSARLHHRSTYWSGSQWRCWGRSCVVVRPPLKTRFSAYPHVDGSGKRPPAARWRPRGRGKEKSASPILLARRASE